MCCTAVGRSLYAIDSYTSFLNSPDFDCSATQKQNLNPLFLTAHLSSEPLEHCGHLKRDRERDRGQDWSLQNLSVILPLYSFYFGLTVQIPATRVSRYERGLDLQLVCFLVDWDRSRYTGLCNHRRPSTSFAPGTWPSRPSSSSPSPLTPSPLASLGVRFIVPVPSPNAKGGNSTGGSFEALINGYCTSDDRRSIFKRKRKYT